jgi:hypothetical protein
MQSDRNAFYKDVVLDGFNKASNDLENHYTYTVMQSDRNAFYKDVVLDSFNKASSDDGYVLDQNTKSKYFRIFNMQILHFKVIIEDAYKR